MAVPVGITTDDRRSLAVAQPTTPRQAGSATLRFFSLYYFVVNHCYLKYIIIYLRQFLALYKLLFQIYVKAAAQLNIQYSRIYFNTICIYQDIRCLLRPLQIPKAIDFYLSWAIFYTCSDTMLKHVWTQILVNMDVASV